MRSTTFPLVQTSAPAKVILLGEHAVVFGEPAIAVAINIRLRCRARPNPEYLMNGVPLSSAHPYVKSCIDSFWTGGPLQIETQSEIPSGSGLGSSAAVTTALIGCLSLLNKKSINQEDIAKRSFEIESLVQGRASPIDTSCCAHGAGIFVDRRISDELLWHVKKDIREWFVHHLDIAPMKMVIGYTGFQAPTGPLVAKVKRFVDRSTFAREVIQEIGAIVQEGKRCLKKGDQEGLGRLLTRNHKLLAILGVSHPMLDKLVYAALPYSYGAKLTGAGGGGSMIAITDNPLKVAEAIRIKGGVPFIVHTGVEGVRVEEA
ncbi:MAG: mevalonate kinase [Methanomassiliicoccales archaeon]